MLQEAPRLFSQSCFTSVGWFRAVSNGYKLICLDWNQTGWSNQDHPDNVSRETIIQLKAYFCGALRYFNLPLEPKDVSQVRRHWLDTMATIPYGTTISYADLAAAAGRPKAARAAGTACATNPIPIIYPCHRILRKNGALGNYGGGSFLPPIHPDNLQRKAYLINHEAQQLNQSRNCLRFN